MTLVSPCLAEKESVGLTLLVRPSIQCAGRMGAGGMGAERAVREEGMSEEEAASYSTLTPARALVCLAVILAVAQVGVILE